MEGIDLPRVQFELKNILSEIIDFCELHGIDYSLAAGSVLGAVRHGDMIPWDDDVDIYMSRTEMNFLVKNWRSETYEVITKNDPNYSTVSTPVKIHNPLISIKEKEDAVTQEDGWKEYGLFVDIFPVDRYPNSLLSKFINRNWGRLLYLKRRAELGFKGRRWTRILYFLVGLAPRKLFEFFDGVIESKIVNTYEAEVTGFGYDVTFSDLWLDNFDMFDTVLADFGALKARIPRQYERYLRSRYGNYHEIPSIENRRIHLLEVDFPP